MKKEELGIIEIVKKQRLWPRPLDFIDTFADGTERVTVLLKMYVYLYGTFLILSNRNPNRNCTITIKNSHIVINKEMH